MFVLNSCSTPAITAGKMKSHRTSHLKILLRNGIGCFHLHSFNSGPQLGYILSLSWYLTMSPDIFGCCNWDGGWEAGETTGIWWEEARDGAKIFTRHRTAPRQLRIIHPKMSIVAMLRNPEKLSHVSHMAVTNWKEDRKLKPIFWEAECLFNN